MDLTERAASDPRETAELVPRLPAGDPGVRMLCGGGTDAVTDAVTDPPLDTTDFAEVEGASSTDEFLLDTVPGGLMSSKANSSPIAVMEVVSQELTSQIQER
jgi:hypothetical protein